MAEPVAEPDGADQLGHPGVVRLLARDRQWEEDVLLRVQHRQQVEELEDEADVLATQLRQLAVSQGRDLLAGDGDRPRGRLVEPREDVHQGRLAGPGRSHHRGQPSSRDVDRNATQGVDSRIAGTVASRHVLRDDDRRSASVFHLRLLVGSDWILPEPCGRRSRANRTLPAASPRASSASRPRPGRRRACPRSRPSRPRRRSAAARSARPGRRGRPDGR